MYRSIVVIALVVSCAACGKVAEEPAADVEPQAEAETTQLVSADGLPLAYSDTGDGDVAVVLIHGWMCDRSYWDAQVPFLASSYRVVAIDLGGHGDSGMEREGWPIGAFPHDVAAVVEHLGLELVILVGHSMGGPVALEASTLLGDRVLGVVGVDTLHNVEAEYDPEQEASFLEALEADFPNACDGFVRSMFPADADPALVERVAADMCGGPAEVGTALMRQYMEYDQAAALAAATVPVRSVNADMWPSDVEANRRHHEDYDAVIVEGVGHFLMMERPEVFNPVLADTLMEVAHSIL
jgi:pimeloyl-ACP methyl ester carboxylesterase